jgi:cobalt-zinc-cadmium efflux system protein
MGHGHSHGHAHAPAEHAGSRNRWRLAVSFAMVAVFFVVELTAGLISGSLALLSDAGHMAADVVALGAALVATRIATRPDTTGRRTFGSYRVEVFASGFTVLMMLGVAVYVVVEAIGRMGHDPDVSSTPMLLVGAIGLLINLISLALLRGGAAESINVKGAYVEVLGDAAGSVGVIAAGTLVAATGNGYWDTAVALAIGIFVAWRAVLLGRDVWRVLAQHAPADMDAEEMAGALAAVPGVEDVHDLHVWTLTSGMNVATAHLVAADAEQVPSVLEAATTVMRDQFGIAHATLQVEPSGNAACEELDW